MKHLGDPSRLKMMFVMETLEMRCFSGAEMFGSRSSQTVRSRLDPGNQSRTGTLPALRQSRGISPYGVKGTMQGTSRLSPSHLRSQISEFRAEILEKMRSKNVLFHRACPCLHLPCSYQDNLLFQSFVPSFFTLSTRALKSLQN